MKTLKQIDENDVKAAVERLFGGAVPLDNDRYFEYSVKMQNPTAGSEISRLEKIVAGKPDHPARGDLLSLRASAEPRGIAFKFWIGDDKTFRFSSDHDYSKDLPYEDGAHGAQGSWRLMRDQMELGSSKVGGNAIDGMFNLARDAASQFHGCGASYIPGGLDLIQVSQLKAESGETPQRERWKATAASSNRMFEAEVTGESVRHESGVVQIVTEIRFLRPADVFAPRIEFRNWRVSGDGSMMAHEVVRFERTGDVSTYTLSENRPVDRATIVRYCETPRLDVADPIRGVPTVKTIVDNTDGTSIFRDLKTGESVPLERPSETAYAPSPSWLGPLGIGCAVVVIVLFGIVRLRRA